VSDLRTKALAIRLAELRVTLRRCQGTDGAFWGYSKGDLTNGQFRKLVAWLTTAPPAVLGNDLVEAMAAAAEALGLEPDPALLGQSPSQGTTTVHISVFLLELLRGAVESFYDHGDDDFGNIEIAQCLDAFDAAIKAATPAQEDVKP
jgi:hypothetical protein